MNNKLETTFKTRKKSSFDLPLLCFVLVATNEQLNRPKDERKEDIHPPPPDLGRVIEHYKYHRVTNYEGVSTKYGGLTQKM